MALYQIFNGINSSIIPENLVLLTRSEQFWKKSAHIRPTIINNEDAIIAVAASGQIQVSYTVPIAKKTIFFLISLSFKSRLECFAIVYIK